MQLIQAAIHALQTYFNVHCPEGLPPIGSKADREPLLLKRTVTNAGAPWESGLTIVTMSNTSRRCARQGLH